MEYEKYEFCKDWGCNEWKMDKRVRLCASKCPFTAYDFHKWLKAKGYKISK